MGIFSKKRHGEMIAVDEVGRRFTWRIGNFSKFKCGATLDGDNVVCFTKAKFHLHMTIGANGDVGVYLHYKATNIPKYSYYFANADGEVMRQHTAHTIPAETQRCGHWNACHHPDLLAFVGTEDVLQLHFCFDDDTLEVTRMPNNQSMIITWKVPQLFKQMLNPFSSMGFVNDRSLLVMRLEVKKEVGAADAFTHYNLDNIKELVFFIFCRVGNIPPHSIELLNAAGKSIAKLDKKEVSGAQTLTVSKKSVMDALGMEGTLQVVLELQIGGNPLDTLNAFPGASQGCGDENDNKLHKAQNGGGNDAYLTMNGDH